MKPDYDNPITLWVCVDCIMHHANGECGGCYEDEHEGGEPLSLLDRTHFTMGLTREEHKCNWPYDDDECDCETTNFSTSSCDGCGSQYHGERHAMTMWEEKQ